MSSSQMGDVAYAGGMTTPTPLGERLRELREAHHWSQAALAADVGITTKTIGRLERGETLGSPTTLKRLAKSLGVAVRELEDLRARRARRRRRFVAVAVEPARLTLEQQLSEMAQRADPHWRGI